MTDATLPPSSSGARFFAVRANLGLTQADMAKKVGVSADRWRRYETDSLPNGTNLARLAELGFNVHWLLTGDGEMFTEMRQGKSQSYQTATVMPGFEERAQAAFEDFLFLPRYDVHAAAGHGALVESEQIVDFIAFRMDWVSRSLGIPPDRLALISAEGDSMTPTIKSGDLLLLDLGVSEVRDNAIYALRVNGTLLVKRLQRLARGGVRIISDNRDYDPEEVAERDLPDLRIVGRVVWHGGLV